MIQKCIPDRSNTSLSNGTAFFEMSLNIECTSEKVLQLFMPPKSAQKRFFDRINVFLNNMKRLNINNLQNHKFLFKNWDLFTFSELPYRSNVVLSNNVSFHWCTCTYFSSPVDKVNLIVYNLALRNG